MAFKPPTSGTTLEETYDETFFKQHERARPAYAHLAGLIRDISPSEAVSVIDVGCGHCILLEELSKHFAEIRGVDGSRRGIPPAMRDRVAVVDMAQPGWGGVGMKETDVVVSLETAEHLPRESSDLFIDTLILHRPKLVVFSAATPYQDLGANTEHVNEQPMSYWVERFEARGYGLSSALSIKMRSTMASSRLYADVAWYLKNILVFTPEVRRSLQFSAQEFIYSSNPTFQLIFERDRLEFENLVLKREWQLVMGDQLPPCVGEAAESKKGSK